MNSSYISPDEIMLLISGVKAEVTFKNRIKEGKVPDDEKEALEQMFGWFHRYGKLLSERIDNRSRERLRSRKRNYRCELIPRTQSASERHVSLPLDAWLDIVGLVIEMKCKACNGKKRCALRNIFFEMRVPEVCPVDPESGIICEYQWGTGGKELLHQSKLKEE